MKILIRPLSFLVTSLLLSCSCLFAQPFVTAHLMGQFGNQLFIMSAAISLALDNQAAYIFPDLTAEIQDPIFNIPLNYKHVFYHLDADPLPSRVEYDHIESDFTYSPIPYYPNMNLFGWFQSEKYFSKHKKEIIEIFSPPEEIVNYLSDKYADILTHPKTVSVHMRSYKVELIVEQQNAYVTYGKEYVEKAMELFPDDSLFVVFSNDMKWCKKELEGITKNIVFIEGEPHYHDFYLMSMCKDNIICNSSFSWWAAYLNQNTNKKIIVPPQWFSDTYIRDTSDLIPKEWTILKY